MEDKYFLADILESEKNLCSNMTTALNEASNEAMYKRLFGMFQSLSESAKVLFNIAYNNNWYTLEEAKETKITQELTKFEEELNK